MDNRRPNRVSRDLDYGGDRGIAKWRSAVYEPKENPEAEDTDEPNSGEGVEGGGSHS